MHENLIFNYLLDYVVNVYEYILKEVTCML